MLRNQPAGPRPEPRSTASRAREALLRKLAENEQARAAKAHEAQVLAAQLRALDQQARRRRQAEVGRLADEVGLLAYDLEVLRRVFADVAATLTQG